MGDKAKMDSTRNVIEKNFKYFGYGYFNDAKEAIPPVGITFYSFHIMVAAGMYFLLFYIVILILIYKNESILTDKKWLQWVMILTIPVVWICSEAGWVTAEVGRQPWVIQDLMPTGAALMPRVQAASHGAGQIRPVNSGKLLVEHLEST
jgi:cytochrome d ubiquinol oxidase subunit I